MRFFDRVEDVAASVANWFDRKIGNLEARWARLSFNGRLLWAFGALIVCALIFEVAKTIF